MTIVDLPRTIRVPQDVATDSALSFGPLAGGAEGFGLIVAIMIHVIGIDIEAADEPVPDDIKHV